MESKNITLRVNSEVYDRYIKPFEYKSEEYRSNYKNGFSIMASCSLMIETLECFYQGFETSDRKADIIFKKFFERNKELSEFKDFFYKKIRCGILHQGETYGGYLIKRKGVLFDKKTKTINATKFLNEMKKMLENYKKELKKSEWDSEVWDNFRTKMRHIIKNCD